MGKMQVERLTARDYDGLLELLNASFGKSGENSFTQILPAMWRRTDEAMGCHLAIRDGARLGAVVGVYPLTVQWGGRRLLLATVGNVGTREECRGQGMMRQLMLAAMEELKRLGVVAARLGGLRQRYARYGFEKAGQRILFRLTRRNLPERAGEGLTFRDVGREDVELLAQMQAMHRRGEMTCERGDEKRFWEVLSAWRSRPQVALDGTGQVVGYLSVASDGMTIAEHGARDEGRRMQVLTDWLRLHEALPSLRFEALPWEVEVLRGGTALAEDWQVESATQLKVIHYLPLLRAALACRARLGGEVPSGRLVVGVRGYGTLLFANGGVEMTDEPAEVTLDRLEATRLFFGQLPAWCTRALSARAQTVASALFPLPFGWNGQDRV